jgi:tetratricopeptide (TPR) repeat protein
MAATLSLNTADRASALLWLQKGLAQHDDRIELHRVYQDLRIDAGEREQVVAEYRAQLAKAPSDVMAGYLVARIEAPAVALSMLRDLHERAPADRYVLRAYAHELASALDHAAAVAVWDALEKVDRTDYEEALPLMGQALAALGRTNEALQKLSQAVSDESRSGALERAVMYARIASAGKVEDPYALAKKLPSFRQPAVNTRFFARLGVAPLTADAAALDEEVRAANKLEVMARTQPSAALALASSAPAEILRNMPEEVWFLLYAEATRLSPKADSPTRKMLRQYCPAGPVWPDVVERFVRDGVESDELQRLPLDMRAKLYFARARSEVPADERSQWLQKARAADLLHDMVDEATLLPPQAG